MSENTIIAGALLLGLAAAAAVLPKRSGQKCPVDIIVALPLVAACWFYWELGRWITVRREKKSNIKKETNTEETLIMRIYRPCTEGFVNHESYEKVSVVPTQAFPQGTFLMKNDYAIEKPDGTLSWLQAARLYKGEEYAEFSNLEGFEKRGEVFWRK